MKMIFFTVSVYLFIRKREQELYYGKMEDQGFCRVKNQVWDNFISYNGRSLENAEELNAVQDLVLTMSYSLARLLSFVLCPLSFFSLSPLHPFTSS